MTPFVLFAGLAAGGLRSPWAWTAFAALSWGLASAAPPRAPLPGAALWAAAVGWAGLSAAASPEPLLSFSAFAYAAAACLWLVLGATRADADERRSGEALLWAAGAGAAACAVLITVPGYRGAGLFYPYYNYTAALAASAGAAALAAWAHGRGPTGLAGAAAATVFLLWTGSRGGLLALGAGSALALWRSGRRLALAAGLAAAAAALALPGPRARLLKLGRAGSHARPGIWRAALAAAADAPLLGVGPGRFSRAALLRPEPTPAALGLPRYFLTADRAHSELLGAAAETGLAGAALLLAALGAVWRRRPEPGAEPARETLLGAAAALGTQALVDSIFALPALGWLFAWCLGAACAPPAGAARPPSPAAPLALAGGLVLAASAWLPGWFVASRRAADPEAALAVAPSDAGLWEQRARLRLRAGDAPAALDSLARAAELSPYDARLPMMAAEVFRASGAWEAALRSAAAAAELEPDCGQCRLQAAEALSRLGRPGEARAQLAALRASRARPLGELAAHSPAARLLWGYDAERLADLERELEVVSVVK